MRTSSRLPILAVVAVLSLAVPGFAAVSLDASGAQDTVLKVVYTGGSTGGGAPVMFVSGKTKGIRSVADYNSSARAIVGVLDGMPEPGDYPGFSNYLPIGVSGGGWVGVAGRGFYGVYGESFETGGYGVYGDAGSSGYAGYFDGDVVVTGDCDPCSPSDARFKKNVREYHGGLSKVMALKPKAYEMKVEDFEGRMKLPSRSQIGLIAQDVEAVFPEMVHEISLPTRSFEEGEDAGQRTPPETFKAINYTDLIPVMLTAIQEQQAEIEALRQTVERLRKP